MYSSNVNFVLTAEKQRGLKCNLYATADTYLVKTFSLIC